eukprot:CAMPEP_0198255254 /NCGR_PEP_ID=MMETSP1447-20131203/5406_1 /TAXON_ID=420782 /ORGANISM="Chaetoceros dichaeta, Strain CCMP1751" /LENGTH=206 /DNA_ID=CAMNT_0043941577 /DNA_START=77 /DNA_END=697 /DNA_ORIENTATION=-
MALVSLAIISHNQKEEVMYIRDFSSVGNSLDDVEYDLFNLPPKYPQGGGSVGGRSSSSIQEQSHDPNYQQQQQQQHTQPHLWDDCSLRHQFLLHSALEKLNEGTRNNRVVHRMRVIFLCCADGCRYYGYTTCTNLKIIVGIEDDILPDMEEKQKEKDGEVSSVLTRLHSMYVNYLLNPFSNQKGKITSKRFNRGVDGLVSEFNGPV